MDGPVIQNAVEVALAGGAHVVDGFRATRAVRDAGAPALVMSYWNLILRRGVDRYAAELAAAGGAGLITPDLIPDEADEWIAASEREGLDRVFLVAPSSTPERLARVTDATPRLRLRGVDDGRHRRAHQRRLRRRATSSSAPGRSPTCPSASGSASRTATRPPSSPSTPTASSSAPPSSAPSAGTGNSGPVSTRCAS